MLKLELSVLNSALAIRPKIIFHGTRIMDNILAKTCSATSQNE